jgi:hypothetical protein
MTAKKFRIVTGAWIAEKNPEPTSSTMPHGEPVDDPVMNFPGNHVI